MPHYFRLANGVSALPAYTLDISALESLMKATSALNEREQQEEHLRKCARCMNLFHWCGQKAKMSQASQMMSMLPFLTMNTTFILCPPLIAVGTSMQTFCSLQNHQLLLHCPAWASRTPSNASMMILCYVTQNRPYLCNTMLDTLILFTVQHMVSSHSSNLTHPK